MDTCLAPARSIFLVGLMGAGKTVIGQALARELGWPFVDSDHEIVERTGVSIPTIFEFEGEPGFRRREQRVIEELTQRPAIVLATGGGAILAESNRRCLRERGWVVYLRQPPEVLFQRTGKCLQRRPMLDTADPLGRLRELYAVRDPLYRQTAHLVLEAPTQGIRGIALGLLERYRAASDQAVTGECREIAVR